MSSLASRIKEAVHSIKKVMGVAEIAKKCGVSPQSIYQWMKEGERVEINASALVEFAYITGYKSRWLVNNAGEKYSFSLNTKKIKILKIIQSFSEDNLNRVLDYCLVLVQATLQIKNTFEAEVIDFNQTQSIFELNSGKPP